MSKPFKIFDWAGNRIGVEEFTTFEDAWDYIFGDMTDRLGLGEDDYQEYQVLQNDSRASRYLDPNDPRPAEVAS